MSVVRVQTADGVPLAVRRVAATRPRQAVLICGHAMMANGSYFGDASAGFAAHLAARGIDVYILDWRGHGASCPPSPRRSQWSFTAYVERDLPAICAAVSLDAGCEMGALCYLGHSLGGLVGLAALGQGVIAAPRRLVLAATSVWTEGPSGSWRRRAIMEVFRSSAALFGAVPVRRLGLGTDDENRQYAGEIAGWAHEGRWSSPTGVAYADLLPTIEVPTLAVVSLADRLCRPADARALHRKLPMVIEERLVGVGAGDARDSDHFAMLRNAAFVGLWDEIADFVVG